MDSGKTLYLLKGTLKIKAKGYWFTSGGGKGSFGYYPHLKDAHGFPVYPDTQVHGDLLMAAKWLRTLGAVYDDEVFKKIFGSEGSQSPSLLFLTDLELTEEAKKGWKPERFEAKPRSEINDETRTNKEHMLASIQVAYLDDLELESDLYVGYFDNDGEPAVALKVLDDAVGFISGFGAFRSRGYGRCKGKRIEWENGGRPEEIVFRSDNAAPVLGEFDYFLRSLVNFRNRHIEPGKTQLLRSQKFIASEQLRGWFVKAYHDLFQVWPTPDDMKAVHFPDLYPSFSGGGRKSLCVPPPVTTVRDEKTEKVRDLWGKSDADEDVDREACLADNFYETKKKPLKDHEFVTTDSAPSVIEVAVENRTRNSMEANFRTKEDGGLFVQQLIRKGASFGGTVRIDDNGSEFANKAMYILRSIRPTVNGAIFGPEIVTEKGRMENKKVGDKPFLVASPIVYKEEIIDMRGKSYTKEGKRVYRPEANQIVLKTLRRYNTTLRRPRRNRIAIDTGSILYDASLPQATPWSGFGKDDLPVVKSPALKKPEKTVDDNEASCEGEAKGYNLNRAQAGFLRELLKSNRSTEEIKKTLEARVEKYQKKGKAVPTGLIPEAVFKKVLECLKNGTRDKMKSYLCTILEGHALKEWEDAQKLKRSSVN